jgi:[ribosomal protein S18]-alanine N-acetyltransferase
MIRKATAVDADALLALERSVPEAAHWHPDVYGQILQTGLEESMLQRWIFVADEGGLMGFIVVKLLRADMAAEAEIENLAVAPQARRSGFGLALCKAALKACETAGVQTVTLEVRAGNRAALGLYAQFGFEQTGHRADYYTNPTEDAVLLRYKQKIAG